MMLWTSPETHSTRLPEADLPRLTESEITFAYRMAAHFGREALVHGLLGKDDMAAPLARVAFRWAERTGAVTR